MALSFKLDLRQRQSLVMTPQLMQAIRLLQMSNLELEAAIQQEVERNPLLESTTADGDSDDRDAATGGTTDPTDADDPGRPERAAIEADEDPGSLEPRFGDADGSDPDYLALTRRLATAPAPDGSGRDLGIEAIAESAMRPTTLSDHVLEQIRLAPWSGVDRAIAVHLVGYLDPTGYFRGDPGSIADELGVSEARVAAVLSLCTGLDPAGVFARSLGECLGLQLADRNRLDPVIGIALDNLDLVAKRDHARLKRLCRVDDADLAELLAEIRALDPKPGLRFDSAPVQAVIPDVFVSRRPDGSFHIELNTQTLPKLLVDRRYYASVAAKVGDAGARAFLSECLQSANWLVKSLDQRAKTILKVATAIAEHQRGFFEHGVEHLRPLTLKTVADAIGMHESTVSRVTANKFLSCQRGLFDLKYFFSVGLASTDGSDAVSAESVRHRIRALIDAELAGNVLSDDAIVHALRQGGIDLARRTVAKYREAMRIPSSVQRRRDKAAPRPR